MHHLSEQCGGRIAAGACAQQPHRDGRFGCSRASTAPDGTEGRARCGDPETLERLGGPAAQRLIFLCWPCSPTTLDLAGKFRCVCWHEMRLAGFSGVDKESTG